MFVFYFVLCYVVLCYFISSLYFFLIRHFRSDAPILYHINNQWNNKRKNGFLKHFVKHPWGIPPPKTLLTACLQAVFMRQGNRHRNSKCKTFVKHFKPAGYEQDTGWWKIRLSDMLFFRKGALFACILVVSIILTQSIKQR